MNLRKDHYRTSLAAVKRSLRELVFSVIVCTEKWDLSRRRRSPRGRSRIPNHASFIRVVGYLRFFPSRKKGVGDVSKTDPSNGLSCDGSKSLILAAPRCTTCFHNHS